MERGSCKRKFERYCDRCSREKGMHMLHSQSRFIECFHDKHNYGAIRNSVFCSRTLWQVDNKSRK